MMGQLLLRLRIFTLTVKIVLTGKLEHYTREELKEKLKTSAPMSRGRIQKRIPNCRHDAAVSGQPRRGIDVERGELEDKFNY